MSENCVVILSTPTCIKCKSIIPKIKEVCDNLEISYVQKNAMAEGMDLVKEFNILSVPTVIVYNDDETPAVFTGDFDIESLFECLRGKV